MWCTNRLSWHPNSDFMAYEPRLLRHMSRFYWGYIEIWCAGQGKSDEWPWHRPDQSSPHRWPRAVAYFQTKSCKIVSYIVSRFLCFFQALEEGKVVVSEILDTNMIFVRPERQKTPIPARILRQHMLLLVPTKFTTSRHRNRSDAAGILYDPPLFYGPHPRRVFSRGGGYKIWPRAYSPRADSSSVHFGCETPKI